MSTKKESILSYIAERERDVISTTVFCFKELARYCAPEGPISLEERSSFMSVCEKLSVNVILEWADANRVTLF